MDYIIKNVIKIEKFVKKNYIYINVTFFLLAIYIILFPLISKILEIINPNFIKCPYLTYTGKPCPLCGGTRYIQGLYHNIFNIKYYFHPFGIMMLFIIFEVILRLYNIITIKKEKSGKIIKIDIIIHIIAIIMFFGYEITYIIMQN